MSAIEFQRRLLEIGNYTFLPCQKKKILVVDINLGIIRILYVPDIRVISEFLNTWLELNDN